MADAPKIDAAASAAVKDAANADAAASVAVAGAASAAAERNVAVAAETAVAAATGAAALAEVKAAEATQAAAIAVNETKGDVSWLKSFAEKGEGFFQNQATVNQATEQAIAALANNQSEFQQKVLKLLTPPQPVPEPGKEVQIVDPAKAPPASGEPPKAAGRDESKNQSRKSRVWTTGRRG